MKSMRVKFILPALTEATSPFFRPVKYSLFPPLGLATLAAYLDAGDFADLEDEHIAPLQPPLPGAFDLVVIQVYITNAYCAYALADRSFVFGMDEDGPDVFARTVEWAIQHGLTTATFHIQTPYPGTRLWQRMAAEGRLLHSNWDLYDTRHVVYQPARLTPAQLEAGYWRAYRDFYRWSSIARAAFSHGSLQHRAKHFSYAAGWKRLEWLWGGVIRARQLRRMTPLLETLLTRAQMNDAQLRHAVTGAPGPGRAAALAPPQRGGS